MKKVDFKGGKRMKKALFVLCCFLILSGCTTDATKILIEGTDIEYSVRLRFYDDIGDPHYVLKTYTVGRSKFNESIVLKIHYRPEITSGEFEITYRGEERRYMDGNIVFEIDGEIYRFKDETLDILRKTKTEINLPGENRAPRPLFETQETNIEKISNYPFTPEKDEKFIEAVKKGKKIRIQYWEYPMILGEKTVQIINHFFTDYFDLTYQELEETRKTQELEESP